MMHLSQVCKGRAARVLLITALSMGLGRMALAEDNLTLLTSPTGGIVTGSGGTPTKAFDGLEPDDVNGRWFDAAANLPNVWVQYQFKNAETHVVNAYKVWNLTLYSPEARAPKDFKLEGSTDGSSWELLDERTGETGWGDAEGRFYTFDNYTAYSHYRFTILANNGDPSWTGVSELEYYFQSGRGDTLVVEGNPAAYGEPEPPYGVTNGVPIDASLACSAPAQISLGEGSRAFCVGYEVYTNETVLVASGTSNAFTHTQLADSRLVWLWQAQVEIMIDAGPGGDVAPAGGWFAAGTVFEVTAEPDEGYRFNLWQGDVDPIDQSLATLTVTADRPQTLTATFVPESVPETREWEGVSGDGAHWDDGANWDPAGVPLPGDSVVIGSAATVVLRSSTPRLAHASVSGTLVFTNWNTALSADEIVVEAGGVVTLPGPFTNAAAACNVALVASNLTVATGGKIDVDGKGYAGGARFNTSPAGDGHGPGRGIGNAYGVGASHGGRGGSAVQMSPAVVYPGASAYGDAAAPLDPGSGGGGSSTASGGLYDGGAGGGAVRIAATGDVVVDGSILANGANGAGAGSGGAISIVCRTFGGTGTLSARGGTGYPQHSTGGHGGGGRIAIRYDLAAQPAGLAASLLASPGGTLAANNGHATRGDFGTIWLADDRFFGTVIGNTVAGRIVGFDALSRDSLTINNTWIRFAEEGFELTVDNDLTVTGAAGMLQVGGGAVLSVYQYEPRYSTLDRWYGPVETAGGEPPVLTVGGNLALTGGAKLALFSAATNGVATDYGALLDVGGNLTIANTSALYPYSHPTNGASPLIRAGGSVAVAAGGRINASGKGFAGSPATGVASYGPGGVPQAFYAAGGGHGGIGGSSHSTAFGGDAYGSAANPVLPGSGGGRVQAAGGGVIRIEAGEGVTVNGELLAGGIGCGSGGSIGIACETFAGTNGLLSATGSNAEVHHGAGGGGRIAVRYDAEKQSAQHVRNMRYTAAAGTHSTERPSAEAGTLFFADSRFLGETLTGLWGKLAWIDEWATPSLTVTNAAVRFMADGFRLTVAGDLTVGAGGILELGGPVDTKEKVALLSATPPGRLRPYPHGLAEPPELRVGGDLALTNGGLLAVYSAVSSAVGSDAGYGARIDVEGHARIHANSWVHPYAHPTNGAAPLLRMKRLTIDAGGGVNADAKGYSGGLRINNVNLTVTGYGPGKGTTSAYPNGAGYGGLGGNNVYANGRGATYGVRETPLYPGSGGGSSSTGGGLIRLEVARTFDLAGTLSANAIDVSNAASGGGIYVRCGTFIGRATAMLNARGGSVTEGHNGAGGGGRIAVWRRAGAEIPVSVAQGTNNEGHASFKETYRADEGTFFWGWLPQPGSMLMVR